MTSTESMLCYASTLGKHQLGVALEMVVDGPIGEDPDSDEWRLVALDIERALADGSLDKHARAADELANYLDGDVPSREWRAINRDLARAGLLVRHDPEAVTIGGRLRTITVDGVAWEAW